MILDVKAPIRPVRGSWPGPLENRGSLKRFFRLDPLTILDPDATPAQFREAMSSIYIGGTIKITGTSRHGAADDLLVENVDLSGANIVDIGASDGSTSVDLISRLEDFASYTIADLYLSLDAVEVGSHTVLFHGDQAVLVGGKYLSAWPELSGVVEMLYRPVIARARKMRSSRSDEVLLLNPTTRALINSDPRVTTQVHDVFTVWPDPKPDVIKIANLLRKLYFSDEQLSEALVAVRDSLPEGGHLLIVENPRIKGIDIRAGLWRREGRELAEVGRVGDPEISHLVEALGHRNVT